MGQGALERLSEATEDVLELMKEGGTKFLMRFRVNSSQKAEKVVAPLLSLLKRRGEKRADHVLGIRGAAAGRRLDRLK